MTLLLKVVTGFFTNLYRNFQLMELLKFRCNDARVESVQ